MTTSFVRRSIALYKMLDADTKAIYKKILGLNNDAKIIEVEHSLEKYEHQVNNVNELILDMEADVEILREKK